MLALPFTPVISVLLLTAGTFLILLELNRPGWILPGCLGVLGVLVAAASILRSAHPIAPLVTFGAYVVIGFLETRLPQRGFRRLTPFVLLTCFLILTAGSHRWSRAIGSVCAISLGFATDYLANIAYLARANKFPRGTSNPTRTPETL